MARGGRKQSAPTNENTIAWAPAIRTQQVTKALQPISIRTRLKRAREVSRKSCHAQYDFSEVLACRHHAMRRGCILHRHRFVDWRGGPPPPPRGTRPPPPPGHHTRPPPPLTPPRGPTAAQLFAP